MELAQRHMPSLVRFPVLSFSTHLCHEHGQVAEFLAVLARLEFEEVQQCEVVPILEEEFILIA